MLEILDLKRLSSAETKMKIFQSLGRLLLESVAEKFLLDFKRCGMIMTLFIYLSTHVDGVAYYVLKRRKIFCIYGSFASCEPCYYYVLFVFTGIN